MKTEFPKRWTMPDCYAGEVWPDYYSAGFGQSRDSDALETSNFRVALQELGGESETVLVVRERHWAVGWIEWIAIHESDREALKVAIELNQRREDYPILDEDDFCSEEDEQAYQIWRDCYDWRERIAYMREHKDECGIGYRDFREFRSAAKGEFFPGYAGELLY